MTDETTTALILSGQGYELLIAPEAAAQKAQLIAAASSITSVTSNDESADAQVHSRRLAQMRIAVEKCRTAVKAPVNKIAKQIDQAAKDFMADIEAEERRITRLVGAHADEVARIRQERLREEHRAFEEARLAREASERAAMAADSTGKIAEVIAARQAEKARVEALAARMEASAAVVETKVADGVRFAWDFEVESIETLYAMDRTLVEVLPRRAVILAKIRDAESLNMDVARTFETLGIRAFQRPIVSSR